MGATMSNSTVDPSRRSFLLGAAPAIAGGLALSSAASEAFAEPAGAREKSDASNEKIWSNEYWAQKGDVKLYMFRKRVGAPQAGKPALPVLFLVHGSSMSSTTFDVTVPGRGEYSMMNVFARYGYDVWTMDHDGYGNSDSSGNNSDIASGVEDLKAAMTVVMQETGQQKIHFYGTSSGG